MPSNLDAVHEKQMWFLIWLKESVWKILLSLQEVQIANKHLTACLSNDPVSLYNHLFQE